MSQPSSQSKADPHLSLKNYLQICLHDDDQFLSANQGQVVTWKDLDKPTPTMVQNLFISMLKILNDSGSAMSYNPPSRMEAVSAAEALQGAVCDTSVDELYRKLLPYFDNDMSFFHYGILIAPETDKKRVKDALAELSCFVWFCDRLYDQHFDPEWQELEIGLGERKQLYTDIESIKSTITNKASEMELWKEQIPHLNEECAELLEKNLTLQQRMNTLDTEVQEKRKAYDVKAEEKHRIEESLLKLSTDKSLFQSDLVLAPDAIIKKAEETHEDLLKAKELRDTYALQCQKCEADEKTLVNVIDAARAIRSRTEKLIEKSKGLTDKVEGITRVNNDALPSKKVYEDYKEQDKALAIATKQLHKQTQDMDKRQAEDSAEKRRRTNDAIKEYKRFPNSIKNILKENNGLEKQILCTREISGNISHEASIIAASIDDIPRFQQEVDDQLREAAEMVERNCNGEV